MRGASNRGPLKIPMMYVVSYGRLSKVQSGQIVLQTLGDSNFQRAF